MVIIEEISVNLCNLKFDISELYRILDNYNQKLKEAYNRKPNRVYIGFEYCDKMVHFFSMRELIAIFNTIENLDMKVTYVIPPVREENFKKHMDILDELISRTNLNEISVNDYGMLNYLHTKRTNNLDIILGRLFDKGIRETRLNIFESEAVKKNSAEISKTNLFDEPYLKLFESFNINRIELDTFPDGVQDVSKAGKLNVSIHYPKVFISRGSYCEAGSIGQKPENKFKLSNMCGFECSKIYKKIILEHNCRELIKLGNAILFHQPEPIGDIVNGKFRLVFSPVFQKDNIIC